MNNRIERITSNLHGTAQNLRSLDHMLEKYKDVGREQKSAIDKLRSDLSKTCDNLKEERHRSSRISAPQSLHASDLDLSTDQTRLKSALRGYDSDVESPTSLRRRKLRSASVRFADDMNRELHSLHQSVRDISLDQGKLEDSFSQEVLRRDVNDANLRRSLRDITQNLPRKEPVESSVERRLQAIQNEIKAERSLMDRRYDEVGEISTDLKQALQYHQRLLNQAPPQPPQTATPTHGLDDIKFHKHYLETEALKHKVETELDHIKRQLDHSEGSKVALSHQIEELKCQLTKAEQEKQRMMSQLTERQAEDSTRERRKKRDLEEERERSHKRFEAEIQDLRSQLTKSLGAVSLSEDMKREVERSERQRVQLSDHIDVLTKDLENKENQYAKIVGQLKEIGDKHETSERQRLHTSGQLEDALARLRDSKDETERLSGELRATQHNLHLSDKKRDEFKIRAQDTVKQWKAKCKQLQQDGDHYKREYTEAMRRNEQLVTDMSAMEKQSNGVTAVIEKMKTELQQSLVTRANLEDMNHKNEKEINELRSVKIEVESEIRDARVNNSRLHHELENATARLAVICKDKGQLEGELSRVTAAQAMAREQNAQLQTDAKDLAHTNKELANQLADANKHVQELNHSITTGTTREKSMHDELNEMKEKMKEDKISHKTRLDELNAQIANVKANHQREIVELSKQVKKEMSEYDAEIDSLKRELEKERCNLKRLRQTDERLHAEMQRLHDQIHEYEEQKIQSVRKIEKLQEDCESQTQKTLEDLQTLKITENELFHTKEQLRTIEEENLTIIERISSDMDEVMAVLTEGSKTKYQESECLPTDASYPLNMASNIRNRLQWVKREIRDQRKEEKKLRQDLLDMMNVSEKDRTFLMSEIAKKEEKLDQLIVMKDELLLRDDQNIDAVVTLNEKLKDIADELKVQKLREEDRVKELISVEKQQTEIERSNIENRYIRLKETMRQLQEDLRESKLTSYQGSGSGDNQIIRRKSTEYSK